MLPVAVSMAGEHLRRDTVILMGWLGPRGLASVVFTLIAYEDFLEAGRPFTALFAMAGWTILLSVLLHGFSAQPLARWYANRLKTADPSAPELMEAPEFEHLNKRQISLSHVSSPHNNPPHIE
jgi:NhaP-type Na+/H+ or K+/H+ antiporter